MENGKDFLENLDSPRLNMIVLNWWSYWMPWSYTVDLTASVWPWRFPTGFRPDSGSYQALFSHNYNRDYNRFESARLRNNIISIIMVFYSCEVRFCILWFLMVVIILWIRWSSMAISSFLTQPIHTSEDAATDTVSKYSVRRGCLYWRSC